MTVSLLYWILMLIWLVCAFPSGLPSRTNWRPAAGSLLLFILMLVLGWQVFGAPIK